MHYIFSRHDNDSDSLRELLEPVMVTLLFFFSKEVL